MGERYREYANQILNNSTDQETGKLDLKLLERETHSLASKLAKEDGSYSYNPKAVTLSYQLHLQRGINEVMGLIPQKEWTHDSDQRSTLENVVHWMTGEKDIEPKITHGLVPHIEDPKLIDGFKSLAEEHVTAKKAQDPKVETPQVQNKKQAQQAQQAVSQSTSKSR